MKLLLLFLSSLMLGPLVVFVLVTSGAAPARLLIPALAFAILVGMAVAAQQWLRLLGIVALRILLVVPALVLIGLCVYAFAALPASHWVLWAILATAVFTLLVGATLAQSGSTPRHIGRPRIA